MMKTLIRHITHDQYVPSILQDGMIKREGCNQHNEKQYAIKLGNPQHLKRVWETHQLVNMSFKLIGRYVWLTEESIAHTATGKDCPCSFEFYAEDIKAKKWSDVKRRLTKKCSILYVKQLDKIAIEMGDDPDKYWVCERPIHLSKCTSCSFTSGLQDAA
jgi:hypothetical protein